MAYSAIFCCAAALVMLLSVASARMVIVEAGVNGKTGPTVVNNLNFCPSQFSAKGFSIQCLDVGGPVTFYVNGKFSRKESVIPYMLAGDTPALGVIPFLAVPKYGFNVNCRSASKNEYAYIKVSCPPSVAVTPEFIDVTPSPQIESTPLAAERVPRSASLVSVPNNAPLPTQAPSPPPTTMAKGNTCLKINGYSNMDLTKGWTVDGTTVWYQRGSTAGGVVPGGTADLDYMFVAPATGTYAITIDMVTANPTEHNDVWLKFRYGLHLRRGATATKPASFIKASGTEYVKAYHNKNGRAVEAWSVDNDPHAISTGTPLRAGRMYKLTLGARSTNVKINSIIMFPCSNDGCTPGSPMWKAGLMACAQ